MAFIDWSSNRRYYCFISSCRFLFSESTRLSSVGGEKALAAMVASLSDSVEEEFGFLASRLFALLKHTSESKLFFYKLIDFL